MSDYVPLLRVMPHRYPMLLIDRVLDLVPGIRCVAAKAVSRNEPCYAAITADHDEQMVAYPSMLLLESWLQASVPLLAADDTRPGGIALLGALSGVEFEGSVYPGDVVTHHVRVVRAIDDTVIVEGESRIGEETRLTVRQAVLARRTADRI